MKLFVSLFAAIAVFCFSTQVFAQGCPPSPYNGCHPSSPHYIAPQYIAPYNPYYYQPAPGFNLQFPNFGIYSTPSPYGGRYLNFGFNLHPRQYKQHTPHNPAPRLGPPAPPRHLPHK